MSVNVLEKAFVFHPTFMGAIKLLFTTQCLAFHMQTPRLVRFWRTASKECIQMWIRCDGVCCACVAYPWTTNPIYSTHKRNSIHGMLQSHSTHSLPSDSIRLGMVEIRVVRTPFGGWQRESFEVVGSWMGFINFTFSYFTGYVKRTMFAASVVRVVVKYIYVVYTRGASFVCWIRSQFVSWYNICLCILYMQCKIIITCHVVQISLELLNTTKFLSYFR